MRVTNAPASRKRRTRMIRAAKGYRMRRSKLYRYASDAVDHGRKYAFRDRRVKKRDFRALWQADFRLPVQAPPPAVDLPTVMLRGFMPAVMTLESPQAVLTWLDGYVSTYLERDLRELSQVESLIDFRRLMQCLALRPGSILNQADVAKDCGLSHATAHRYIKLLEVSNIISRVPAWYASRNKRLVKSPKVFFLDPALSIFLSGYTDRDALLQSRELGGYFETLVFLHLRALCELLTPAARIYFWRT